MERHLRLEGTRNLRDVGGYPTRQGGRTRWRTLFRSDCLDRLSPAGQAWLAESPAEVMLGVLEELDRRYGSVAGYLASIGVEAAALERLRALLTEGDGP